MSKRTVRSVKRSCDLLWAQVVKARAGYRCERCGAEPEAARGFQAHHAAYKRNNHRLRFEPRNGTALCGACHNWAENNPLDFADWFRAKRPGDAAWLITENQLGLIRRDFQNYLEVEAKLRLAMQNERDPDDNQAEGRRPPAAHDPAGGERR